MRPAPKELPATTAPVAPMGEGFTPDEVQAVKESHRAPRPPSLLTWHPKRWTVLAGLVVPLCGNLAYAHATNNVRQVGGGFQVKQALAIQAEDGWTAIPLRYGPLSDGKGGRTYIRQVHKPTAHNHGWYCHAWETVPGGNVDLVRADVPGYARWLRGLIDRGVIDQPDPVILDRLRNKYLSDAGIFEAMSEKQPIHRLDAKRCREAADIVEAELERLVKELEPVGEAVGSDLEAPEDLEPEDQDEPEKSGPPAPAATKARK